jgi:hypothetical protein
MCPSVHAQLLPSGAELQFSATFPDEDDSAFRSP